MQRRAFLETMGVAAMTTVLRDPLPSPRPGDVREWRTHFPALAQEIEGQPLTYLDSAATTLRPHAVIDAVANFYRRENANPGATLHTLARRSAALLDDARRTVAGYIGANDPSEVVFTRGTTDGINLVAAAWGGANLRPGDEILLGVAEHASNMVPWMLVAKRTGAAIRYFDIDDAGHASVEDFESRLTSRTRVVAFSHVSNVLGMINPAKALCARARAPNRIVVVDAAQSVPHFPVDVRDIGCDFLAFSGHKMLGPMGVGVLWGRRDLLDAMPPYQGGSNMAHDVDLDSMHLSEGALKFGAGTPNVSGPIGLAAAIRFFTSIGRDTLAAHEHSIVTHALDRFARMRNVRLFGSTTAADRIPVFAFNVGRMPAIDVLRAADARGVALRAGDLASLPLLKRLGATSAVRVSCYLYTTVGDVDRFADVVEQLR